MSATLRSWSWWQREHADRIWDRTTWFIRRPLAQTRVSTQDPPTPCVKTRAPLRSRPPPGAPAAAHRSRLQKTPRMLRTGLHTVLRQGLRTVLRTRLHRPPALPGSLRRSPRLCGCGRVLTSPSAHPPRPPTWKKEGGRQEKKRGEVRGARRGIGAPAGGSRASAGPRASGPWPGSAPGRNSGRGHRRVVIRASATRCG